jgi:hypothetical protein
LVNVTGKWVLEKGQLTHVFAMSEEFLAVQLDLLMRSAHGGEFSSQVSSSGFGCCSAAVVALGVGSCSAALERSGVFAGQRRAAAAQLGSTGHWQRQRGVGSGSVAGAQLGSAVLSSQGSAAQLGSAVRWQW